MFLAHARESLGYHYERNPADPRVSHELKLEVDDFGNVLKSATVAYGRRQPDPALEPRDQARQAELHLVYAEHDVTNDVQCADDYRAPLPSESRALRGDGPAAAAGARPLQIDAVADAPSRRLRDPLRAEPGPAPSRSGVSSRSCGPSIGATISGGASARAGWNRVGLPFETYQLALTRA